jgi:hypothetical protein
VQAFVAHGWQYKRKVKLELGSVTVISSVAFQAVVILMLLFSAVRLARGPEVCPSFSIC